MKRFATLYCFLCLCLAGCDRRTDKDGVPVAPLQIRTLETALLAYKAHFDQWPIPASESGELKNSDIIAVLTGDSNNEAAMKQNPTRITFLALGNAKLRNGASVDPWGNPYHIALIVAGDKKVRLGGTGRSSGLAIWSNGPNGIDEQGSGDDIASVVSRK